MLCAVFPVFAATPPFTIDYIYAESLIWEGRLEEAREYLESWAKVIPGGMDRHLCLTYALLGNNDRALHYCSAALSDDLRLTMADCVRREKEQPGSIEATECNMLGMNYTEFAETLALHALSYWRAGDFENASARLIFTHDAKKPPPWLVEMIAIVVRRQEDQQPRAISRLYRRAELEQKPHLDLAYARFFPDLKAKQEEAEAAAQRPKSYTVIVLMALPAAEPVHAACR